MQQALEMIEKLKAKGAKGAQGTGTEPAQEVDVQALKERIEKVYGA
jgi:hypothetical protein